MTKENDRKSDSAEDNILRSVPLTSQSIFYRRAVSIGCLSVAVSCIFSLSINRDITTTTLASWRALYHLLLWLSLSILMLILGSSSPRWSPLYSLFGMKAPNVWCGGTVQPGYEPVRQAFLTHLKMGMEVGLQFVAYVNNECVVNLVGASSYDDVHFGSDRFTSKAYYPCFSTGKVLESAVAAWLVEQGHLDYNAKISKYWPEFTGGDKETLLVSQLLKHEAGLREGPHHAMTFQDLFPENLARNSLSAILQDMQCKFPKDTNVREYHAMTRGLILNELVRRVDPQHRTLGQILAQEICRPLGVDDGCYIGMPKELSNPETNPNFYWNQPAPSILWILCNKLCCRLLGLPTTCTWRQSLFVTVMALHYPMHWTRQRVYKHHPTHHHKSFFSLSQQPLYVQGENPSTAAVASATALAVVANALATRNDSVFGKGAGAGLVEAYRHKSTKNFMPGAPNTFNDGGFCVFQDEPVFVVKGLPGAMGWMGLNGSAMLFHPRGDFAVAFQPTAVNDHFREARLTSALAHCARKLHGDEWGR